MEPDESLKWLEGKTIAFFGDSLTAEMRSNYVTLVLDLLADRIDMTKVRVFNSGVDSSTIQDALDRLPEVIEEIDPDVLVVLIGINDSKIFRYLDSPLVGLKQFGDSYQSFLDRADANRPRKKVIATLPDLLFDEIRSGDFLAEYWYWDQSNYAEYNTVIREAAYLRECIVAEVDTAFRNEKGVRLYYEDGVHPNIYGHRIIAREILKALERLA